MMNVLSKEFNCKLTLFLIIFLCYYFPLLASISVLFNVYSSAISIALRLVMVLIAVYLIFVYFINKRNLFKLSSPQWFLVSFWVYYIVQMQIDLWSGIKMSGYENVSIYGFTYGNIVLSLFAILLWGKKIKLNKFPNILLYLFAIINIAILIYVISNTDGFNPAIFHVRLHLMSQNSHGDLAILNPITIGLQGSLLFLTSLYFILFKNKKGIALFIIFAFLGILILLLGASRGPFINCLVVTFFLLLKKMLTIHFNAMSLLKYVAVIGIMVTILLNTIGKAVSIKDIYLLERIGTTVDEIETGKEEHRDLQYHYAIQDFIDNPIFGKHFVSTFDNFYPHNIFIELLMATGLVGIILFSMFFFPLISKLIYFYKIKPQSPYFFLLIISMPVFLSNLFSGCLFMSVDMWLLSALVISSNTKYDIQNTKDYSSVNSMIIT